MSFITRNILDFYKINHINKEHDSYLETNFTFNNHYGRFTPYAQNIFSFENNNSDTWVGTVDEVNTYNINKFGLRGDLDENAEILASGCSVTFGVGLPESGIWTQLLSSLLNKNIVNLSSSGASVQSICNSIITYCINNKMPKAIFCLFPDFFRSLIVADKEFYKSKKFSKSTIENENLLLTYCGPTIFFKDENIYMEIKNNKYIEDSRSPHQLILDSFNSIAMLEMFCLSNNIKLFWTTWDIPTSNIIKELSKLDNFKLKKFINYYEKENQKKWFVDENCSIDHKSKFKNNICWNNGSDYAVVDGKKQSNTSHPGIHFHVHVADLFYNMYN